MMDTAETTIAPVEKAKQDIQHYLTSFATDPNEVNRQQCGHAVLDVLKEQPLDDILQHIHHIASIISMAAEDTDVFVKAVLVQLIPEIFARCVELANAELEYYLFDRMLEITLRFLKNDEKMIRESAVTSIKVLLLKNYLGLQRIEDMVCPVSAELLQLEGLHEDDLKDRVPDAFSIMALLAPIIGKEKTNDFFLEKFLELCTNERYEVRKMCAMYCPHLCKVMGIETSEKQLIPAFLNLCEDSTWDVRKTSADSIRIIGLLCSDQFRRQTVCPALYKLMNDSCRWVYRAAAESLGLFISSFAKPCILGVAYRPNGELYIPNAADADYKQHSQGEILTNYETYERIFEESATAPPTMNRESNGNDSMTYTAIAQAAVEPRVENPHFSSPETFHNAASFRSYDNHGYGKSISSLLDTFTENDYSSSSRSSLSHFDRIDIFNDQLRRPEFPRNTPPDFPMIVREAMRNKTTGRKFSRKIPRQNAIWYVEDANSQSQTPTSNALEIPETPLIENAPDSEDFLWNNASKNLNESAEDHATDTIKNQKSKKSAEISFVNNIDSMHLDDADENLANALDNIKIGDEINDINSNIDIKLKADNEDDDEVFREYNSHQYWYISPDMPVDTDILLDPEEKKVRMEIQEELDLRRFDRAKLPPNYQSQAVPGDLIKYFVSLAHSQDSTVVNYFCAYHFPAVVLTLGRQNWSVMCNLLQVLCNHGVEDIRKTMASSIYLIGLIIGRQLATQDLVPIYLRFFEEQDKVKVVALQNLCNFLSVIDRPEYDIIVNSLSNCLGEYYEAGWRFREELAQQILNLVVMFEDQSWTIHKTNLTGVTVKLLRDKVNSIRKIALDTIIEICKKVNTEEIQDISKLLIDELGVNSNWRHRQIFSEFCSRWILLEPPLYTSVFNNLIFKTVVQLANDGVPNIRMGIAKCLSSALTRPHNFENNEQYEEAVKILRQLQCDRDSDVREMAICSALPPPDNIEDDFNYEHDNDKDHQYVAASISNASTVDMNSTDEDGCAKDGEDSEESQDSIKSYSDTDDINDTNTST